MRRLSYRLLREPLAQFIVGGFILFLMVEVLASDQGISNNPHDIVVDQTALANYLQFQSRAFDANAPLAPLQTLSPDDKEQLITDYICDEVLYREALALGLDENDEVIRRRLIQKLDFVNRGLLANTTTISEAELQEYFSAHINDYTVDASITFTHVFLDKRKHGTEEAVLLAEEMCDRLNTNRVPFEEAARYGDRFHFHRNYVDRTPEYVESHFGPDMAARIFNLSSSMNRWSGPFVSPYGAHLVMATRILPSRIPELEEVASLVLEDARRVKLDDARRAALEKLIGRYNIRRELPGEATDKYNVIDPNGDGR